MSSPLSSAQQARREIAQRLHGLRRTAGLSGKELAERCGWNQAKTSRIENARTVPSDSDVRAWCAACRVPEQAADLIAATRNADAMYVGWRRLHQSGMRRNQQADVPLYESTRQFHVYLSNVMPGLTQTQAYGAALLRLITEFQGTPDDSEAAAAARVERNQVMRRGDHRFALLIEEHVLYHRYGDQDTMQAQLGYLLRAMEFPSVSIGVIPTAAQRLMWGIETFMIFDESFVQVETLTALISIRTPVEVRAYAAAFSRLAAMAVFGASARALVNRAADSLG